MTNMVEIGQNFDSGLDRSKDISKRSSFDRLKGWIAAAAAGVVLTTGAGVAKDARAEEATPTVDNPTKIEGEVDSSEVLVKDEMPQLPEDNSSEPETIVPEGQITAKGGVGDLLANANNGVVTSGDVGVEVPGSNGGEVKYASNVTNESGEPIIVPLEGGGSGEVEKSAEQIIAENIVNYLSAAPGHTDEDIKFGLITLKTEKTDDLGLIHSPYVQGRMLGYAKTITGDNLLIFFGTKDKKRERFVTVSRIPLYTVCDTLSPIKFRTGVLGSNEWSGGIPSGSAIKDETILINTLNGEINRNVIFGLIAKEPTAKEIKKYGTCDSSRVYLDEMKKNVFYTRSLNAAVYRNGISKLDYKDPGLNLWEITPESVNADLVKNQLNLLITKNNVVNIPVSIGIFYTK